MKYCTILIAACLVLLTACPGNQKDGNWYAKLAPYKTGMDATPLIRELEQGGYPSRTFPNYSDNEVKAIYFLPRGDVHLTTLKNEAGQPLMLSKPFFVTSGRSVEKRIEIWEQQFK